jgi:predicted nucleotidyltransferase
MACGCPAIVWGMYDSGVIEEVGRRISAAAPGSRVVLFGSHARGEAHASSDLDLLVVEPEVADAAREEVRLRRELRGLGVFADVMVVSEVDAERLRGVRSTVVGRALDEGRVLAA